MKSLPLLIVPILLAGCEAPVERASFQEAFFAYRDALAEYHGDDDGLSTELDAVLTPLGWSYTELRETLEGIRNNDPEGYRSLHNLYRARRGLPEE
jgi:hypothetical protein